MLQYLDSASVALLTFLAIVIAGFIIAIFKSLREGWNDPTEVPDIRRFSDEEYQKRLSGQQ